MSEKFDFRPGDIISFCDAHYTVIINHETDESGVVVEGDDISGTSLTLIAFKWEFSGDKSTLVRRYPHKIRTGLRCYYDNPESGIVHRIRVLDISVIQKEDGGVITPITFEDSRFPNPKVLLPEDFIPRLVPDRVGEIMAKYWKLSLCGGCENMYYPKLLRENKCSHCIVDSGGSGKFFSLEDEYLVFHTLPNDFFGLMLDIDIGLQQLKIIGAEAESIFSILEDNRNSPVTKALAAISDLLPIKLP